MLPKRQEAITRMETGMAMHKQGLSHQQEISKLRQDDALREMQKSQPEEKEESDDTVKAMSGEIESLKKMIEMMNEKQAGSRVVSAEKIKDGKGRLKALRRKHADGSTSEVMVN